MEIPVMHGLMARFSLHRMHELQVVAQNPSLSANDFEERKCACQFKVIHLL
jgi:hypothetical protein